MSKIESLIGNTEFFRGLSPAGKAALASVCRERSLAKREYLFNEGQRGEAVYLLADGAVQLTKSSSDGREVVVRSVMPGDLFAEVVLFERDCYPVNAVAVKRSLVYGIPKKSFLGLLNDVTFRNDFIGMLFKRMRYLADRLLYLTTGDVEQRFFGFLEEQYGRKQEYTLALARKDIASAIGATPETVSRLLLKLSRRKTITLKGRNLRLKTGFWDSPGQCRP